MTATSLVPLLEVRLLCDTARNDLKSRKKDILEERLMALESIIGRTGYCPVQDPDQIYAQLFILRKSAERRMRGYSRQFWVETSEFHHSVNGGQGGILSVIKNHRDQKGDDKLMPPVVFDREVRDFLQELEQPLPVPEAAQVVMGMDFY